MCKLSVFIRRKNIELALQKLGYDKSCKYKANKLFLEFRKELNDIKLKQLDPGALPRDFVVSRLVSVYGFDERTIMEAFDIDQ